MLTLGSATVGLGHLTLRPVELVGTTLVTIGVLALAALGTTTFEPGTVNRLLMDISGLAVLAPMGFALAYSWALSTGSDHLQYETIAMVHGSLDHVRVRHLRPRRLANGPSRPSSGASEHSARDRKVGEQACRASMVSASAGDLSGR